MMTALTGRTTEPKARNSRTRVVRVTNARVVGRVRTIASVLSSCRGWAAHQHLVRACGRLRGADVPHQPGRGVVVDLALVGHGQVGGLVAGAENLGAVRAVQVGELRAEGFQVVVGDTSGDDHVDLADPACGEVLAEHLRGLAAVSVVWQVALVGGADVERGQRRRERDEHGSDRDQVEDGRRITLWASRDQPPTRSSTSVPELRRTRMGSRSASMRGPTTASRAGRTTSAATRSNRTTAIPPKPIDPRMGCGKNSSPAKAMRTVIPEKATVRPAVARVAGRALVTCPVRRISSRNRLTRNRP